MLEVVLFGPPVVRHTAGDPLPLPRVATNLLAYLVIDGGRPRSRDALATALCADVPEYTARHRVSTSLWRLRRVLERDRPGTYITSTAHDVGIDARDVWVDVADFETRVAPVLAAPPDAMDDGGAKALSEAVALYRGDLLEGTYDDWVLRERDRLSDVHLAALARLVLWHQGRDADAALRYARLILDRDPLREDVHRAVMRAYADLGRRTEALHQFDVCQEVLSAELGLTPLPETTALAAAIAAGRPHALPDRAANVADVVARLRDAQSQLGTLQEEVQRAIDDLVG